MQKLEWVSHITNVLHSGFPFSVSIVDENKAPLLFACDIFRRRNHDVRINIQPSETRKAVLHVWISCKPTTLEFTVRRYDTAANIIERMSDPYIECVTVRGCGMVTNTVCGVVEHAIHSGWFVEKTFMSTLTQTLPAQSKQRNTTLHVVLRRGSLICTI